MRIGEHSPIAKPVAAAPVAAPMAAQAPVIAGDRYTGPTTTTPPAIETGGVKGNWRRFLPGFV
ncbi:MAG: hypothetical protein ACK46X_16260, partial [Candidatus Sericytochromatia bacterium]